MITARCRRTVAALSWAEDLLGVAVHDDFAVAVPAVLVQTFSEPVHKDLLPGCPPLGEAPGVVTARCLDVSVDEVDQGAELVLVQRHECGPGGAFGVLVRVAQPSAPCSFLG